MWRRGYVLSEDRRAGDGMEGRLDQGRAAVGRAAGFLADISLSGPFGGDKRIDSYPSLKAKESLA